MPDRYPAIEDHAVIGDLHTVALVAPDGTIDFLPDTIHTTQKAMGSISYTDATAGIEPANAWAVVTAWFDRIADAVTTELTERWGDKIAAVDTFTPATVEALVVSLSTDAPAHLP